MNRFVILFFLFIVACTNNNTVFWCGDHPCINKKEQEAYFKKTMIVEARDREDYKSKDKSISENILKQARENEKERILNEREIAKVAKIEEKRRVKEQKEIDKQIKLDQKKRIKEEKLLAKQIEIDEKKRLEEIKKTKKLEEKKKLKEIKKTKKLDKKKIDISKNQTEVAKRVNDNDSFKFVNLLKNIINRNSLRPYPEINDIPE